MNAERFEQVHGIKKGGKDVTLLCLCFLDTPALHILPSTNNRVLDKPHKLIAGIIASAYTGWQHCVRP